MVTATDRRVQRVPALHICTLAAEGILPSLPAEVEAAMGHERTPTLNEISMLSWLVYGDPMRPLGVAAYRGVYDFPRCADAREIIHVAGSPRAIVALTRHIVEHARKKNLRVFGSIGMENRPMMALLSGLGYVRTRIVFEDR
jgi:hypothetical protein